MTIEEIKKNAPIGAELTDGINFYRNRGGLQVWSNGAWCRIAVIGIRESQLNDLYLKMNLKPL